MKFNKPSYIPYNLEYCDGHVRSPKFDGGPFTDTQLFKNKDKTTFGIHGYEWSYKDGSKRPWVTHILFNYAFIKNKKIQRVKIERVFEALAKGDLMYAGWKK